MSPEFVESFSYEGVFLGTFEAEVSLDNFITSSLGDVLSHEEVTVLTISAFSLNCIG